MNDETLNPIIERAENAKEIARPIAERIRWGYDASGALVLFQAGAITAEERLAVIMSALANDATNLIYEVRFLQARVKELEAYTDKLAAGLPEGMLPKDIELLLDANAKLAQQLFDLQQKKQG